MITVSRAVRIGHTEQVLTVSAPTIHEAVSTLEALVQLEQDRQDAIRAQDLRLN